MAFFITSFISLSFLRSLYLHEQILELEANYYICEQRIRDLLEKERFDKLLIVVELLSFEFLLQSFFHNFVGQK